MQGYTLNEYDCPGFKLLDNSFENENQIIRKSSQNNSKFDHLVFSFNKKNSTKMDGNIENIDKYETNFKKLNNNVDNSKSDIQNEFDLFDT